MQTVVVTPTGDRPKTLALCAEYMARQTRRPDRWIVVDDGQSPCGQIDGAEIIRRVPGPDDPKHTLIKNIHHGLAYVPPDALVVVMEDDDWYSRFYLANMFPALADADLTGQPKTHYYDYAGGRVWHVGNMGHCSLCVTGFRAWVVQSMPEIDGHSLDLTLWRNPVLTKKMLPEYPTLAVGMKGLPGRRGQSLGWDFDRPEWRHDPRREWLIALIGEEDAARYARMMIEAKLEDQCTA